MSAKAKTPLYKDILKLSAVVLLFTAIAYIFYLNKDQLKNPEYFREMIQRDYSLGVLFFLAVGSLAGGFGIPRLLISGAAGMLFGAFAGTFFGLAASLLGATVNFFWARLFMRNMMIRRLPQKMKPWYDRFNQNGFRYMLYLRLFPLSNSTATNTLGGISQMKYLTFIASTFIGWIPLGIIAATFGSSAAKQDKSQLIYGIVFFVTFFIIENLIRKFAKKDLDEVEAEVSQDCNTDDSDK